jgi:hypothetical protein
MKSPLIIGADVRSLSAASLAILKNKLLLEINQGEQAHTLNHYECASMRCILKWFDVHFTTSR